MIYAADFMDIEQLLANGCEYALTIDSVLQDGVVALDSLSEGLVEQQTLIVVELLLIEHGKRQYQLLWSDLQENHKVALDMLQNLKARKMIGEDLSISDHRYRSPDHRAGVLISYGARLDVLEQSKDGLQKEITLLKKTKEWLLNYSGSFPLEVLLGLLTMVWMR